MPMYILESLQPRCAEICCTHDVLNHHKVIIICILKQRLGQMFEIFEQEATKIVRIHWQWNWGEWSNDTYEV